MAAQSEFTVRQARAEYFARNRFGENGGYDAKWVKLKAGPIVFGFPNTKGRVRAVRLHDVHHILTGYETTWIGEAEIGAWEVASGCGRYYAGWILNLPGMAMGLFLSPQRVYRAFLRGRQSCNFYHGKFPENVLESRLNWRDGGCGWIDQYNQLLPTIKSLFLPGVPWAWLCLPGHSGFLRVRL